MIHRHFVAQKMLEWNHSCTVAAHEESFCMGVVDYRTERSKVRRIVLGFLPVSDLQPGCVRPSIHLLDLQSNGPHQFQPIALRNHALAQLEVKPHPAVLQVILKMHVPQHALR